MFISESLRSRASVCSVFGVFGQAQDLPLHCFVEVLFCGRFLARRLRVGLLFGCFVGWWFSVVVESGFPPSRE